MSNINTLWGGNNFIFIVALLARDCNPILPNEVFTIVTVIHLTSAKQLCCFSYSTPSLLDAFISVFKEINFQQKHFVELEPLHTNETR